MDEKDIKKNLREKRMKAGLSQESMAEKLNLSRVTYIKMENGETRMINGNLFKAAEVLDCNPEELVLGYAPYEMSESKLRDVQKENEELRERLENMQSENETLREKCRLLQEQNDLKTEIITMLKNNR